MLNQITFYLLFGKPLIMWGGIITIALFFVGAYIGNSALKGKANLNHHLLIIRIALFLAILHAVLGVLAFF